MKHIKFLMLFCAFAVMFAAPGWAVTTEVNSITALKAAIGKAASRDIKLTSNITLTSKDKAIEISGDVVVVSIDLNSYDIIATDTRAIHIMSGDVRIYGKGVISATSKDKGDAANFKASSSVIRVGDANKTNSIAKLTIEKNVTVSSDFCYGVSVFGKNSIDIAFVLNGTVSVTGGACAVGGNGTADLSETNITINGTAKSAKELAIYHPGAGNLIINGTVEGVGGIEAKSGKADAGKTSVSLGKTAKITSTATKLYHEKYSNGPSTTGFAISAVQNKDYKGNVKINIGSGAVIDGYVVALSDDVFKFSPATVSMEVNVASIDAGTATLSYDTYPGAISITGGVFSKRPYKDTDASKSYVSKDYVVVPLNDSDDVYKYGVIAAATIAKPTLSIDVNGKVSTDYTAVYSKDQKLVLTALPTPADIASVDIAYTYKWTKSEDKTVSADTKVFTLSGDVADSGTYKCVIEVSMDGKVLGSADATVKVTITEEESETKEITVAISADKTSMAVGETATFKITTVSPDLTGAVYTWFKGTASTDKTSSTDNFVVSSDEAGSFDVYVLVTSGDYIGSSDKVTITVTEAEEDEKATITIAPKSGTSATLPEGTVGTAYTATLSEYFTVTTSPDSSAAYTWSATGLPAGLSVSADAITGTPTASADAATVTVKVTLSDDTTVSANATATITIKAASGGSGSDTPDDYSKMSSSDVAKLAVKEDGTISQDVVDALLENFEKKSNGSYNLSEIAKNEQLVAIFAASAKAKDGEVSLSTVALDSDSFSSGISGMLSAIASANGTTTSTMTLNLAGQSSLLTKVSGLSGVSLKALSLTDNEYVTEVDLKGATIPTVTLTGSAVEELTLGTTANVQTVNASGLDTLASIDIAGNPYIQDLNVNQTSIQTLNAKGCTNLDNLAASGGSTAGGGSLKELDITSCDNLTQLYVENNQLLGVKKPSPSFAKSGFVFSASGQRRAAPSGFTLSTSMNFWSILRTLLGLGTSGTIPFTVTTTTVTFNYGGTLNNETGMVTYSTTPTAFSYTYNPGFTTAESPLATSAADNTMDVQIGDSSSTTTEDVKLPSSSGGGCDAGFGFGALAALMAVFALKKRR